MKKLVYAIVLGTFATALAGCQASGTTSGSGAMGGSGTASGSGTVRPLDSASGGHHHHGGGDRTKAQSGASADVQTSTSGSAKTTTR